MIRKLLILPPVLVGVAVLAFLISGREPPEREVYSERAQRVRTIAVAAQELVPRVVGYGAVRPAKVWHAVAQVPGEVVAIHPQFKKGAILKAGAEIVLISPLDYDLAIARAEANIRSTDAQLAELKVNEENTRASLAIEARAQEIRDQELQRAETLLQRGNAAQATVDQQSREALSQRMKVQELRNTLRLIPTQRSVLEEQRAVYEAELESARLDLLRTRIQLPFDARIAEANVEATQFVQAGETLAVADGLETAEIEAQIPIVRFRALAQAVADNWDGGGLAPESFERIAERLGFAVTVRLRTGDPPIEWPGRFARISDTVDPETRTIGVIAAVDGAYAQAIPGQRPPLTKGLFVEIELRAKTLEGRLLVPRSALHEGALYLADGEDRLRVRPVETGLVQGDLVVIQAGLSAGERVVVSDLSPAIEGMLLEPLDDPVVSARIAREAVGRDPDR